MSCGEVALCPSHGQDQRAGCFGSAALNFFPTSVCHATLFLCGPRNLSARTNSSIFAITSPRDQRRPVMSVASWRHAQVVRKCHWRVYLAVGVAGFAGLRAPAPQIGGYATTKQKPRFGGLVGCCDMKNQRMQNEYITCGSGVQPSCRTRSRATGVNSGS